MMTGRRYAGVEAEIDSRAALLKRFVDFCRFLSIR
jgi:hypothetical protein